MPVLPNGKWVDDDEYAEMQFQALAAQTVPMSGSFLGTNYSFTPTTENVGLNLGWDAAPNLSAGFIFDPSVSSSNAYVSDYDVAASGMLPVGIYSSPNAELGLTAGIQGTDISDPNPYMNVGVTDVVPGLNVSTGTNKPSTASFTSSAIPGLGISKTSGGPTQAAFTKEISPGVTANISTDPSRNNPTGLKFESSWDDAGKMFRQFLGAINPISDAGADASVPEIAVAPSMQGVDYSQALADVGMGTVPTVRPAYWADAPEYSSADSWAELSEDQRDAMRHGAMILGTDLSDTYDMDWKDWSPVPGGFDVLGPFASQAATQEQRHAFANLRDNVPGFMSDVVSERVAAGNRFGTPFTDVDDIPSTATEPLTEKLKDIINNQIAMTTDLAPSLSGLTQQEKFDMYKTNPNVVTGPAQLEAMVNLALMGHYKDKDAVQASIDEIEHQVDTFKDIPAAPAKPAGPTKAELQAAAQAKHEENLRVAELTRQAVARQAAQAAEAQAAIDRVAAAQEVQRFMQTRAYQEEGVGLTAAQKDALAAGQVDTFAGYGGPMSAAEINVAGGMEFGGAGGMAGSGRGSSGRGGPGGRGR